MRLHLALALLPPLAGFGLHGTAAAQGLRNFCAAARSHVDGDPKLSDAVRQVFGQPVYNVPSRQDAACLYPLKVLRYGTADVLLTIGNEPGQACHGCSASLSAYVLARTGGGLKLVNKAIDFGQAGTFGSPGDISPIRIGRDDGIAIESGGTFQGHASTVLDFYAFHGGRVVHVDAEPRVSLSASDGGAVGDDGPTTEVSGSWVIPPEATDTLRVDYKVTVGRRRSAASATWRLIGPRWVLSAGALPAALKAGQ